MEFIEKLLNAPAEDVNRFLFALIILIIARVFLKIVDRVMENNKTLMQQQLVTMRDISNAVTLHNQGATRSRTQFLLYMRQTRQNVLENKSILQDHMLHSDMLYSLIGDLSVTERDTRGKINDVILPAIQRIETTITEMRGYYERNQQRTDHATDETINLAALPVISGHGNIEHRDTSISPDERAGGNDTDHTPG